jgi:hypothetical protein
LKYGKGKHPNSLKNLKPVQKGEVRNPNGRPRDDECLTSIMKQVCLEEKEYILRNGETVKKPRLVRVVEKCLELAEGGDIAGIREILKYNLPLPMQHYGIGENGEVVIRVKYDDSDNDYGKGNSG